MKVRIKRSLVSLALLTATLIGCQWTRKQPQSAAPTTAPVSVAAAPARVSPATAIASPATALSSAQPSSTQPATVNDDALLARGTQLYAKQCAACHGAQGLGDGTAAYLLYPKPRDFSQGTFRLTSTKSGLPTDDDLLQTLRRGMPGSAMPAWGWLPESDLQALVAVVKHLAIEGKITRIRETSKTMPREKALKLAHKLLDAGPVVPFPPRPQAKIDLNRGKALYTANCVACHGADGRGKDKRDLKDQSGFPVFSRDFTKGIFKGGSTESDIARRLLVGMPGSPMPAAASMPPEDFWAMVAYVQSFVPAGAQERVQMAQHTLPVKRISGTITSEPANLAWDQVPSTFLAVTPLFWRDERIEGLNVRALHDGSSIAIQVTWSDASSDERTVKPQQFTDGVAIQLAPGDDPPFFAMGQKDAQVNIWHWKASWQHDINGGQSFAEVYPDRAHLNQVAEAPQFPDFQTARDVGNPIAQPKHTSSIENLTAAGFGTLTNLGPAAQGVVGTAKRTADGWQVVFVNPLKPVNPGVLALQPGQPLSIGFAVWDGAAGDRNGQKSVTIWHRMTIEK